MWWKRSFWKVEKGERWFHKGPALKHQSVTLNNLPYVCCLRNFVAVGQDGDRSPCSGKTRQVKDALALKETRPLGVLKNHASSLLVRKEILETVKGKRHQSTEMNKTSDTIDIQYREICALIRALDKRKRLNCNLHSITSHRIPLLFRIGKMP